jgi:hypothetical protein
MRQQLADGVVPRHRDDGVRPRVAGPHVRREVAEAYVRGAPQAGPQAGAALLGHLGPEHDLGAQGAPALDPGHPLEVDPHQGVAVVPSSHGHEDAWTTDATRDGVDGVAEIPAEAGPAVDAVGKGVFLRRVEDAGAPVDPDFVVEVLDRLEAAGAPQQPARALRFVEDVAEAEHDARAAPTAQRFQGGNELSAHARRALVDHHEVRIEALHDDAQGLPAHAPHLRRVGAQGSGAVALGSGAIEGGELEIVHAVRDLEALHDRRAGDDQRGGFGPRARQLPREQERPADVPDACRVVRVEEEAELVTDARTSEGRFRRAAARRGLVRPEHSFSPRP